MPYKTENKKLHRYPGIQPFSRDYQDVFFGRSNDIESLYKYLNVNNLVVLYGKSGLGKSSLLNAGLIPVVEDRQKFKTIFFRFGSYSGSNPSQLQHTFVQKILESLTKGQQPFLPELNLAAEEISIWQHLKALEWAYRKEEGFLLVLDQFEEVFTYPDEEVDDFGKAFSEVVNNRMPEAFRRKLYEKVENDDTFLNRNGDQVDFIDQPTPLKILIGIRSDRLSLLDRFSVHLPNILKNTYELSPLDLYQAKQAIVAPAANYGQFISPPFTYNEHFLEVILDYLSKGGTRPVETFLLQIICQHIEDKMVGVAGNSSKESNEVSQEDIGNLDSIARSYYVNVIQGKDQLGVQRFTEHEQLMVRHFIETNLIDVVNHHRISLDKTFVEKQGFEDDLLDKLVNARIIRQEPNTVSGVSYELSHDTLIDPVLQSAQILGNLDEKIKAYYRKRVDRPLQQFVETHFISSEGQIKPFDPTALKEIKEPIKKLVEAKITRPLPDDQYALYPMFAKSSLGYRSERAGKKLATEQKMRRRMTLLAIMGFLLALIAVTATVYATKESIAATKARQEAQKQTQIALDERRQADTLRLLAELAQDEALIQRDSAEFERQKAIQERNRAENEKLEADTARAEALRQRTLAERKADSLRVVIMQVQEARRLTEIQKDSAEAARKLAELRLEEINKQIRTIDFQEKQLNVQPILTRARDLWDVDRTIALRLAEHAYRTEPFDSTEAFLYDMIGNTENFFYKKTYTGFSGRVYSLDFSSNDQYVLMGSLDSTATLWELPNGTPIELKGHKAGVSSIYFAPSEELILTGSMKGTIRLWDFKGRQIGEFVAGEGPIYAINFSPNGKQIITGGGKSIAKIWDRAYKNLKTLSGGYSDLYVATFSPDGQKILTGGISDTIFIWNNDGNLIRAVGGFGLVNAAEYSPDGEQILIGGGGGMAHIISPEGNRITDKHFGFPIFSSCFSSDGQKVIAGLRNGEIAIWDWATDEVTILYGHSLAVYAVANSHQGYQFLSGSEDQTAKLWDFQHSSLRQEIIDAYSKGIPFSEVKNLIDQFLASNEVAELQSDEKIKYGITSKGQSGK